MICASVNRFFTSDLPCRMIGLSTEVLLKMGGTSGGCRAYHFLEKTRVSITREIAGRSSLDGCRIEGRRIVSSRRLARGRSEHLGLSQPRRPSGYYPTLRRPGFFGSLRGVALLAAGQPRLPRTSARHGKVRQTERGPVGISLLALFLMLLGARLSPSACCVGAGGGSCCRLPCGSRIPNSVAKSRPGTPLRGA